MKGVNLPVSNVRSKLFIVPIIKVSGVPYWILSETHHPRWFKWRDSMKEIFQRSVGEKETWEAEVVPFLELKGQRKKKELQSQSAWCQRGVERPCRNSTQEATQLLSEESWGKNTLNYLFGLCCSSPWEGIPIAKPNQNAASREPSWCGAQDLDPRHKAVRLREENGSQG